MYHCKFYIIAKKITFKQKEAYIYVILLMLEKNIKL